MPTVNYAILFGGCGFIGLYFAKHLLDNNLIDKVVLCDLPEPQCLPLYKKIQESGIAKKIELVRCDVRKKITLQVDGSVKLIGNFAAVHREPGHQAYEYYETNIRGAENVCAWASEVECQHIVFTSSIAPYGVEDCVKNEKTLPVPATPYGCSKLIAEKIHEGWLKEDSGNRYLTIVRPGVVFGAYEGGNVTRLVNAVKGRYFFFVGNQDVKKASIYVKELCLVLHWAMSKQREENRNHFLFNGVMPTAYTLNYFVKAVNEVLKNKKSFYIKMPYWLLYFGVLIVELILRPSGVKHPFSITRVKKLIRSNNIYSEVLNKEGYKFRYDLLGALNDWKTDRPDDWL